MGLFGDDEWGQGGQEIDELSIGTYMLYYSRDELSVFKKLAKDCIKDMFPETYRDSNVSDALLKLLKQKYENTNVEEAVDNTTGGSSEVEVPG